MEIGNQGIDNLKGKSWINKEVAPAVSGCHLTTAPCCFYGSATGSAYGYNTSPLLFSLIDAIGRFRRYGIPFFAHNMLFNLVTTYRKEGSRADMQGDSRNRNFFIYNMLQ